MTVATDGLLAAIDCGTNSTRLLIANQPGQSFVRETRITRLGQGVDRHGSLDEEAIERTLNALRFYRDEIDRLGVRKGRMVATSAVRDASNGPTFLSAAADVVGFKAELLSGEEEGRLAYAGAMVGLEPTEGEDVVVDIGGGSTEFIVCGDGTPSVVSLNVGSVRLTERCLVGDPPTSSQIAAATATIRRQLDDALAAAPALGALTKESRLIGLAGTVATLAVLILRLPSYDRQRVHHAVLSLDAITDWCDTLLGEPAVARTARPGVSLGREDIIAAGALILQEVMRRLGFAACVASESDILDGLILSLVGP